VFVLDRASVWGWGWHSQTSFVLRLVTFGVISTALLRKMSQSKRRGQPAGQSTEVTWLVVGLPAAGAIALGLSSATRALSIGLLVAWIEELVFRREMPAALAAQIGGAKPAAACGAAGVILAQISFAACHFVGRDHPPPFGYGLPFARDYAGGGALALVYAAFGLPAAVAVHFAFNELDSIGQLRRFGALPGWVAVLNACLVSLAILFRSPVAAMMRPYGAKILRLRSRSSSAP